MNVKNSNGPVPEKIQTNNVRKGLTVFIVDDHRGEMSWFSDELYLPAHCYLQI